MVEDARKHVEENSISGLNHLWTPPPTEQAKLAATVPRRTVQLVWPYAHAMSRTPLACGTAYPESTSACSIEFGWNKPSPTPRRTTSKPTPCEGHIRQIVGWREFMQTYEDLGVKMRTTMTAHPSTTARRALAPLTTPSIAFLTGTETIERRVGTHSCSSANLIPKSKGGSWKCSSTTTGSWCPTYAMSQNETGLITPVLTQNPP